MYNSSLLLNLQTSPINFALESYLLLCTRECYVAQCNPACAGVRDTWLYLHEIMNAYFRSHIEDALTGDLGERPNARWVICQAQSYSHFCNGLL
jgi:hypothetical protein